MSNFSKDSILNLEKNHSETFQLSSNTKKLISKILNEEMNLNFKKFITPYQVDIKNKKYFKEYLSEISLELISYSYKKKGISKYIFSKYYKLSGMICIRLFSVFNENNDNNEFLSAENFIENMLNLFTGDFDYLSKLIFKLFDFKNDGNITYEEVCIILSYIPIRHSNYDNKKFKFEQDEFIDRIQTQKEIALALKVLFSSKKNILTYNEFVNIIKDKSSDIFIFLLLYLFEKKPFSKEIIELYKEESTSEEEEESDDDNNDNKEDIFIKPPMINEDKTMTPQIVNKSVIYNNKNTPLNGPIYIYKSNIHKGSDENNSNKKNNNNNILFHSKSEKQLIKSVNENDEKNTENIYRKISYQKENKLFPVKRKSKIIKKNQSFHFKSKWDLKHFSLSGVNNISDSEDSEISIESEKEKEQEINSDKDEEMSDNSGLNQELNLNNDNKKNLKEGYFYKLSSNGKIKKIIIKLINNHLFYYKTCDCHCGVDCLVRAFIKESYPREINGKYYYCFLLIFRKKEKEFFFDKEEEYLSWLKLLKKILHCEDINDLYDIQNKIGEGRFALVYKGIHKPSKRTVAIKILEKKNLNIQEINMIHNEIEILKICQHPNILKLYDIIENHEKIYIITEKIEGPDLFTYLENKNFDIDEIESNKIIKRLASALLYLNIFCIVHRDIKPENIILTTNEPNYDIKLIDFGLGIILGPQETSIQPFGTVSYVAPEVLSGKEYNKSVDIWTIGILSYLLLVGRLPFDNPDDNENEIARQTINEPAPFIENKWNIISNEAKDFVSKCLEKDPKNRMDINEVINHKWLKKYITEEQKNKENKLERLSSFEILKILSQKDVKD